MAGGRTIWHPSFARLLTQRAPHWAVVRSEVQLGDEPLVVDDLIELRADQVHDPSDRGETLRGLWPHIRRVGLMEFKSVSRALRRGDVFRLFAYGWLYLSQRQSRAGGGELLSLVELTVILVVPSRTPTLEDELREIGIVLPEAADGYHVVAERGLKLVVVDVTAAANAEDDDLLRWFGRETPRTVATRQWVGQYVEQRGDQMDHAKELEGYEDWERKFLAMVPVEKRLEGVAPEERLAGLGPEERLAGLGPGEWALALPLDALQALPRSIVDGLPPAVRDAVRARLAG